MTIMKEGEASVEVDGASIKNDVKDVAGGKPDKPSERKEEDGGIFSRENISSDSDVDVEDSGVEDVTLTSEKKKITVTADDKTAFINSVVSNSRFIKNYSLFGGKVDFTARSLTVDEVNALAAWMAKVGSNDPAGVIAGKYRKYLAAAQIGRYNGVDMPPLEDPLFETLGSDGKSTVQPGWVNRASFWDGMNSGVFDSVMRCLKDFDARYSILCDEAENANFWNPDTP